MSKQFTIENCAGFSKQQLDALNQAFAIIAFENDIIEEDDVSSEAICDALFNLWIENTVETTGQLVSSYKARH